MDERHRRGEGSWRPASLPCRLWADASGVAQPCAWWTGSRPSSNLLKRLIYFEKGLRDTASAITNCQPRLHEETSFYHQSLAYAHSKSRNKRISLSPKLVVSAKKSNPSPPSPLTQLRILFNRYRCLNSHGHQQRRGGG
jgi:hypothetical protein